jgi:hypothetical protein
MTEIDIAGLRVLAQVATPGPWQCGEWRSEGFNQVVAEHGVVADCDFNDGRFIAAANPATVLALCDALEAARGHREALFALLDDIDTVNDIVKSNDAAFRQAANTIHPKRFKYATTDGYKVEWLGGEA